MNYYRKRLQEAYQLDNKSEEILKDLSRWARDNYSDRHKLIIGRWFGKGRVKIMGEMVRNIQWGYRNEETEAWKIWVLLARAIERDGYPDELERTFKGVDFNRLTGVLTIEPRNIDN